MKRYFDYFCIYLIILLNKSYLVCIYPEIITIIAFLFIIFFVIVLKIRISINKRDIINLVVLFLLLMGEVLITEYSLDLLTIIRLFMIFIITYISINEIEYFKEKFIYVVSLLALLSIIFFSIQCLGIDLFANLAFKYAKTNYGSGGFLYLFNYSRHLNRNCGIFSEPGVYQIVLNYALYLLLFHNITINPKLKKYLTIIIIITLISALSTAGLILLVIQLIAWCYKTRRINIKTVLIFSVLFVIFFPLLKPYTVDKFLYNEDIGRFENTSSAVRFSDLVTDYKIFIDKPVGIGYTNYHSSFGQYRPGRTSSSNGITSMFAVLGIFISLFYFLTLIGNITYSKNSIVNKLVLLSFFFVVGFTQPIIFLPLIIGLFFRTNKVYDEGYVIS